MAAPTVFRRGCVGFLRDRAVEQRPPQGSGSALGSWLRPACLLWNLFHLAIASLDEMQRNGPRNTNLFAWMEDRASVGERLQNGDRNKFHDTPVPTLNAFACSRATSTEMNAPNPMIAL